MDRFLINSRTAISVSGGRTSAYMLWRVLQSNGGKLPPNTVALFANTGKEEEATLRFVHECEQRWNVPIIWVEYRADERKFAVVNFETASRNGEPFEALINFRGYIPNPVTRNCTGELKIRSMHRYLKMLGWGDTDGWDQMIGVRADEPRRVSKIRARGHSTESSKETMCLPLADAGVTLDAVHSFWAAQPFGLELKTDAKGRTVAGNCDLCFLKPANQILSLIREKPERAIWWAKMEDTIHGAQKYSGNGHRFRQDRPSYAEMMKFAGQQTEMFAHDEAIECYCGE